MLESFQKGGWDAWEQVFEQEPLTTAQIVDHTKEKVGIPKLSLKKNELLQQAHIEGALSLIHI